MGSVDHSSMLNNNCKDEDNDDGNKNNNRLITISNITFQLHHSHYSLAVLSQTTYYSIHNCMLQNFMSYWNYKLYTQMQDIKKAISKAVCLERQPHKVAVRLWAALKLTKIKLLEVEGGGARVPLPVSWRCQCFPPNIQKVNSKASFDRQSTAMILTTKLKRANKTIQCTKTYEK